MGNRQAITKPKAFGLLIACIIAIFGIKYYFNANDDLSYEPVAPVEQSDGTIRYTLFHLNTNQKPFKYEPWELAIPRDVYVSRPEELNDLANDLGEIQVNGVSINAGFRPNHSFDIFYKVPEIEIYKDPLGKRPSISALKRNGDVIRVNIKGWLKLSKIPSFQNYGCVFNSEVYPGVFSLRDAKSGEISQKDGSYIYAGERGCFGSSDDEYYAVITPKNGYVGYFYCNDQQEICHSLLRDENYSIQLNFAYDQIKYLPKLFDVSGNFIEMVTLKLPESLETTQ